MIESDGDEVFRGNDHNDTSFNPESFVPYYAPDPNYQSLDTANYSTLITEISNTNSTTRNHTPPELLMVVGAFDIVRRFFNFLFV